MSSIMRRRRGLKSAISILLSEGGGLQHPHPLSQEAIYPTFPLTPRQRLRSIPPHEFARKPAPEPRFPANPIAGVPVISIGGQSLRDISRPTKSLILQEKMSLAQLRRHFRRLATVVAEVSH